MARKATKKAARKATYTLWLSSPNRAAVELAKLLGYDGITLDLEHGVFNRESADTLILLARQSGLKSFARIAAPTRIDIQHVLDSGADGVIIPHVENLDHARELASYAKYPPAGDRSVGGGRTWNYGTPPKSWTQIENRRVRCYPMIETATALADVDAILALPTVDGVFLGPFDLNMSRGRKGTFGKDDTADRKRVADAAVKAGKDWGMNVYSADDMKASRQLGLTFAALTDDITALSEALTRTIADARRIIGR